MNRIVSCGLAALVLLSTNLPVQAQAVGDDSCTDIIAVGGGALCEPGSDEETDIIAVGGGAL
jgi:hypothetical protein